MSSCHQQACLPGVAPWASCLMVAGPTFGSRSFHSATQFPPNLTTTPCLPRQNRRCFLTPYISSCTAEWFCCQIHCFRIPSELTSEFCALQQGLSNLVAATWAKMRLHTTKQAKQSTAALDEVRAPSLCHLAPRLSRSGETRPQGACALTVPRLCAVQRQHRLVIC